TAFVVRRPSCRTAYAEPVVYVYLRINGREPLHKSIIGAQKRTRAQSAQRTTPTRIGPSNDGERRNHQGQRSRDRYYDLIDKVSGAGLHARKTCARSRDALELLDPIREDGIRR